MPSQRELVASATLPWVPTTTFTFDGNTSDLALQLYTRYAAKDTINQLNLSIVPDTVVSRLNGVGVTFDALDGFAQRAVLWDSGFAVTADNEAKQIWTIDGRSMAEIALTLDEYEATDCTAFKCTQPDGTETYNNNQCTGTTMFKGVKCIAEEFEQRNLNLAMWSIGGESTMLPEIELVNHNWQGDGINYTVYAVHTESSAVERMYGNVCSATESYGYLSFPCYGASAVPDSVDKTEPAPSNWVTSWMQEYSSTSSSKDDLDSSKGSHGSTNSGSASNNTSGSSGTSTAVLGGAVGGGLALLLVGVLLGLCIARRRRQRKLSSEDVEIPKPSDHVEMMTPDPTRWSEGQRDTVSTHPRCTLDESQQRPGVAARSSADSLANSGINRSAPPPRPHPSADCRLSAPAPLPSRHKDDFRDSRHVQPPIHQENTRQSAPDSTIQLMPYKQNNRAFGSDVVPPPPYEEALRSNQKPKPAIGVSSGFHHEVNIRGLDPNSVLEVLATDPSISRRRVQLDELQVEKQLPMTSLQTDSYIARYGGKQVRVKRLALTQKIDVAALENLAIEIRRRAHIEHPNIVQFIGIGWSSALDVTMVVEFLPLGTLRTYLDHIKTGNGGWTPEKTMMAAGIARALAYLHNQIPVYIYHELCAKIVLLTNELEAKLADCGSPETPPTFEATATSHQAFWIAPEVLKGAPHSSAADIYSFGVLLAELDTCQYPYYDALSPSGSNLGQTDILALVTEGRLRPSFTAECPQFIRQLGIACCQQDPERRLTAAQVAQLLEVSSSN